MIIILSIILFSFTKRSNSVKGFILSIVYFVQIRPLARENKASVTE